MRFRVLLLLTTTLFFSVYVAVMASIQYSRPYGFPAFLFLFFIFEFFSLVVLYRIYADHTILISWGGDLFAATSVAWAVGSLGVWNAFGSMVYPYYSPLEVLLTAAMPVTFLQCLLYFGGAFAGIKLSPHSDRVKNQILFIILKAQRNTFAIPELAERVGRHPDIVVEALKSLVHDGALVGYFDPQTGELVVPES